MYVITNREIVVKRQGLSMFGDKPSPNGAQDLRGIAHTRDQHVVVLGDEVIVPEQDLHILSSP